MLTIAIDCRKIRDGGIGTYLRNLLISWQRLKVDARFSLFCRPEDEELLNFPPDYARIVRHDYPKYSLSELFSFKKPVAGIQADLFFTPHYTLPFDLRCPSVATIHDLIHLRRPVRFALAGRIYARSIISHAGRKCAVILTVSDHSKRDIQALFPGWSDKVRVVNPGVDTDLFKPYSDAQVSQFKRERALPDEFVLYTGALKRHKNPMALVEIANKLKYPVVIASRDERTYQNRILPAIIHKDRLRIFEVDDDLELALLYNSARMFVFPSYYEGFGLPPLEAMACGLPVVCSSKTSLPEVVGDAALMFSPEDIPGMLAKVQECWESEQIRDRLKKSGFQRARIFNWEYTARTVFGVFKEVLHV
jgi:glycosyltransferase involved in cell wall biosynthesis